jgi:hypothetical protein
LRQKKENLFDEKLAEKVGGILSEVQPARKLLGVVHIGI